MARPKSTTPIKDKRIYVRITKSEEKEIKELVKKHRLVTPTNFLREAIYFYKKFILNNVNKKRKL